jgi:hypothetical protein
MRHPIKSGDKDWLNNGIDKILKVATSIDISAPERQILMVWNSLGQSEQR